jgi:hypothetical protein
MIPRFNVRAGLGLTKMGSLAWKALRGFCFLRNWKGMDYLSVSIDYGRHSLGRRSCCSAYLYSGYLREGIASRLR